MNPATLDIQAIRTDFPILNREINGYPLIYLDNAATSQTPRQVIDTISDYYLRYNANIHRGVHTLAQEATDAYESARGILQRHFNAAHSHEIIFTSGTTHSINLVTHGFRGILKKGDEVLVSAMEHHSNIVPVQMLCEATEATLRVIPMDEDGELVLEAYREALNENTRLVFFNHVSNALGTINPAKEMIRWAHEVGAVVLVDGAQAAPHLPVDVQDLEADFYTASGHKMCGPTGIGMLYGKERWLNTLPPFQGGGEMISEVTFEKTSYAELPHKFEAGTPNICGGIAFGAAVTYMEKIGMQTIADYEHELLEYATNELKKIPGIRFYGRAKDKAAVISFNIDGVHPYDLGTLLDKMGIAVRTGHHCAQPIMDFYKIPGTVRASFSFYNTLEEIDSFIAGLQKAIAMLK